MWRSGNQNNYSPQSHGDIEKNKGKAKPDTTEAAEATGVQATIVGRARIPAAGSAGTIGMTSPIESRRIG